MKIKNILFALVVLLVPSLSFGQVGTALTQTTLGSTIGLGQTSFALASVTGISGFGSGINSPTGGTVASGNITDIYIDRELTQVISVNTTAKTVVVIRGQGGSQASAHASGTMVLVAPPGAFFNYNPEGYCGSISAPNGPAIGNPPQYATWVNQRTSEQWICSTVTNTWVPGFGNPGTSGTPIANTTLVADAAGAVLPSGPQFEMGGGTNAVTGFTIPVGFNATAAGGGSFTVIPTTAWTWTTAGNIATSGTAVANLAITFRWDAKTSKFIVQQSK